jgi:putative exosortase-associated protein (TIGR04073 family)
MKTIHAALTIVTALLVLCAGCSTTTSIYVQDEDYTQTASRKLGRGIVNLVTSPLEIPNQSFKLAEKQEDPMAQAAGYAGGLFLGVGHFFGRMTSGMVDIFTFPVTSWDQALVDPEYIEPADTFWLKYP